MSRVFLSAIQLAVLALFAPCAHGQLAGFYSCANGNPGTAFDFSDIGVFFDALEAQGVAGPVTLNLFDDGGPFIATTSYALGSIPTAQGFTNAPVVGLSIVNTLTLQAATGESPILQGSAGQYPGETGTLFFHIDPCMNNGSYSGSSA